MQLYPVRRQRILQDAVVKTGYMAKRLIADKAMRNVERMGNSDKNIGVQGGLQSDGFIGISEEIGGKRCRRYEVVLGSMVRNIFKMSGI